MKSLNITVRINSGFALLLWIACFFALLWMSQHHPSIENEFPVAMTGLSAAFGGYLLKRHGNNKVDLEAEKLGLRNGEKGDPLT